jgi:spore coat polysaccharide biosynthesis protein SpsF (cytidylyltransferase family)
MMKTGILITARLGSTRLKQKHMLKVREKPIINYLIERIRREFKEEIAQNKIEVVIATSDEADNLTFERLGIENLKVFYGSIHNIPLRHFQAVDYYGLSHAISVDGDDILCSVTAMRAIYNALLNGEDYVKTEGLPLGMNAMGYSRSFLESSVKSHLNDTLETGWGRIFNTSVLKTIEMGLTKDERLRFTLDYEEDYKFLGCIIELLGDAVYSATDQEIVALVFKDDLWRLNENVCKEYWQNFSKQRDQESNK